MAEACMAKAPTINERLEKLIDIACTAVDRANSIRDKLFTDERNERGESSVPLAPPSIESKIAKLAEEIIAVLDLLAVIQNRL